MSADPHEETYIPAGAILLVWGVAILVCTALFTLSACASQPAKLPPPAPVQAVSCLPMRQYSKAQQQQAAQELAKLPSDSIVAQMVTDYGALRDVDRAACQSK